MAQVPGQALVLAPRPGRVPQQVQTQAPQRLFLAQSLAQRF
jgi:hypothetical protein